MDKTNMIQAVVFDFDGVIADTEYLHYLAFKDVLEPEGLRWSWEDYTARFMGFDDRDALRAAFKEHGRELRGEELAMYVDRKAAAFAARAEQDVKLYPGVLDLLKHLTKRIPLALCSGALRSDIAPVLRQHELEDVFDVMVTADDVAASKPDPTCYTMAVQLLAQRHNIVLEPSRCVAIEDTPTGIQAALGAGLQVWAVTNTHGEDAVQEAHRILASLEPVLAEWKLKHDAAMMQQQ
jgi:beta-phosphoglucomutase